MKSKIFVLLFIAVLSLNSCSSDDDTVVEDNGTTTGDYFPLANNNKWWYLDNNNVVSLVYVGITKSFDNVPYYRLNDDGDEYQVPSWITKKGASYYHRTEQVLIPQGSATIEFDGYEMKIFKDDLPVGGTWTGKPKFKVKVYNGGPAQNVPASLTYTGTILERDAIETINGTAYTNIIKMKIDAVETINGQTAYINTVYWFAKDVGLIRESVTSSLDNITKTRYLTSFEPAD